LFFLGGLANYYGFMMATKSFVFSFEDVEVREREFSLTKAGELLTIEPKAFRALIFLLHNRQKLVRKEELLHAVWGDTAVTDGSLTRCIWLLRNVLGEDTRNPRYIETVPTVGYRFIAPVEERVESSERQRFQSASDLGSAPEALSGLGGSAIHVAEGVSRVRWPWIAVVVALASLAALGITWWRIPPTVPVVESITQLTDDGKAGIKSYLVADGSRLYFNEGPPYALKIAQVSVTGGPTSLVETNLEDQTITGVAPNGSELLVVGGPSDIKEPSLWSVPLPAGEPRRLVSGVETNAADFLPDGRIIFAQGAHVFTANRDASNQVKIATLPGYVYGDMAVSTSPDGRRVFLAMHVNHSELSEIFEMAPDGSDLRKIRSLGPEVGGFGWSPDPRYFIYLSHQGTRYDIWALPRARRLFHRSAEPIRLTTGPLSFQDFTFGRDGKIFAVADKGRGQLVRYDMKSHEFMPLLGGISATNATFSRDGGWVAYTTYPDHALWRSRSDGSKRMQLTYPPMEVAWPCISPDGTRIAFESNSVVYVIDINGGAPEKIVEKSGIPVWSPDGNFLVVSGTTWQYIGLSVVDMRSRKITLIPMHDYQWNGFWLSDGLLAAHNGDNTQLMTFDLKTGKWSNLIAGNFANSAASPDHKYLYFATTGSEPKVERLRIADHQVETVVSLKDFSRAPYYRGTTLGVAPDGSPILTRDMSSPEIYALTVRWP
jgi:DNA-binding winged helix-turn-helix (wHTH) protein/Tol biopolymer transport system component